MKKILVTSILGLLTGLLILVWIKLQSMDDENDSKFITDVINIELALIEYASEEGALPTSLLDLDEEAIEILKKHNGPNGDLVIVEAYNGSGGWVYSNSERLIGLNDYNEEFMHKIRLPKNTNVREEK